MKSEIELNFDKLNENIVSYFQNNDESLRAARDLFAPFIESNRQWENVKNIHHLLALLKRRGIYSKFNFNTFRIFQKIIEDENFSTLVAQHQKLLETHSDTGDELKNTYSVRSKVWKSNIDNATTSRIASNQIPKPADDVLNEIFNLIADGISPDEFRRLARHLDLSKEEIKDIELKCNDFRTQNLVLLNKFEFKGYSMARLLKILNLIEKFDLVKVITDVMNRNK